MTEHERSALLIVAVMTIDAAVCFFVLHRPVAGAVCTALVVVGMMTAFILTRQTR